MNNICKLILNFHKESLLGTDSLNTVGLKGQHCDILSCVFVCVCVCGWVCVCIPFSKEEMFWCLIENVIEYCL